MTYSSYPASFTIAHISYQLSHSKPQPTCSTSFVMPLFLCPGHPCLNFQLRYEVWESVGGKDSGVVVAMGNRIPWSQEPDSMKIRMKVAGKDQNCAELGKPKCWKGATGRHQNYDRQKLEAREISGKEGRSHLPKMLTFFIVIISQNLFDFDFLSLMTPRESQPLSSLWQLYPDYSSIRFYMV